MSDDENKVPEEDQRPLTPEEAEVLERAMHHTSVGELSEKIGVKVDTVFYATNMYQEMNVKLEVATKLAENIMKEKTQDNIKKLDKQISTLINQVQHVEVKYALLGLLYLNYLEATKSAEYMKKTERKEYQH
ncbi:MAG: hypothetical protein OXC41_03575 [Gammaproteobacteria bacterium]|nr:hypothetical protein [Gammaproteobacteria bacterium]